MYTIFSNLVFTNKYLSLWEKETKNQEEGRSMPEAMVKEGPEKLQSPLVLLKLKRRAEKIKRLKIHLQPFSIYKIKLFSS